MTISEQIQKLTYTKLVDKLKALLPVILSGKQDALVSGTNLKTVGGNTLLGSGNVDFPTVDATPTNGSTNAVQSDGVFDALVLKANVNNPSFTGTVTIPSATALVITGGSASNVVMGTGQHINFIANVRVSTLKSTALSTSNTAILNTDTITQFAEKTQGQIDAIISGDGNISKTANYTIVTADYGKNGVLNVYVDAIAGAVQISLEAPATMGSATATKVVNVIKTDASANAVTVKGNGSTNINGANTYVISTQYDNASIKSNGTQYYLFT